MILKTYLFSQVSGRYQQYTNDSSETFLRAACKNCPAQDQIVIHRDGNLMYYAYIHKSLVSEIYGVCIVCGEICLDVEGLYKIFQQTFESAARKGILFRYSDNGDIKKNVDYFSNEAADVDNVFRELMDAIEVCPSFWDSLPPEDLSIPLDGQIRFAFDEDKAEKIVDATRHYHNVIITLENATPSSFALIVRSKNDEIVELKKENQDLKNENRKIKQQKKQIQVVITLFVILIGCGFWLLSLNDDLNLTQGKLDEANDSIISKNMLIEQKNEKISSLHLTLADEQTKRARAESKLENFKGEIGKCIPILITSVDIGNTDYNNNIITDYGNIIYSSSTMYLSPRISYTGINSGESITLYH